jgi:uncharacterized integral membrane protein (TIGR00698 family)
MTNSIQLDASEIGNQPKPPSTALGWRELWLKEDWWAIWIGIGLVLVAYVLFANGSSLKWLAVTPPKWSAFADLGKHFSENWLRYLAQYVVWIAVFSVALKTLGHKLREFIQSFTFLYLLSVLIFTAGQWVDASRYNLEPPLVALVLGLIISNLTPLPRWLDAGFRVEFYVKIGIILLGATLPFTLILWAGPVAILQASIVSIVTFLVIFFVALRLGLDRRFAATLAAGGAVCGVSASIAIAGAVGAKKEHASVSISVVILWAIVMIFVLPIASRYLQLPTGVAGAWIGTSEFADAAGFAAAQTYGGYAGQVPGISGTADQAVWAFTLMKVVGRDVWIGIWAFVLAIIATTRWEKTETGRKANAAEIWWRFPKFVLGFVLASLLITWVAHAYSYADFGKLVVPGLTDPIKNLRTWAFIFCFFSIGLTTRFGELAHAGKKPLFAFSAGVIINVALGFVLSVYVFGGHWTNLTH